MCVCVCECACTTLHCGINKQNSLSCLHCFPFSLCSHDTSFPLSIFNLLFFPLPQRFSPQPPLKKQKNFSYPFVISLFVSHLFPLIPSSFSSLNQPPPPIIRWLCLHFFLLPFVPPSIPLLLPLLPCRVWEVTTGEVLNTLIHHNEAVLHLRFANGLMVTCSKDRSIAVWDMASPTDISLRRVLVGHRAAVNVVDFDDKYIVSASGDRTIKVKRADVKSLQTTNSLSVSGNHWWTTCSHKKKFVLRFN